MVSDVKGVQRRFGEDNCNEKNVTLAKPSCSVNDSLKRLYPSPGKTAVNAVRGWKAKRSKSESSSYPIFKKRFTETLKDVFLISDPSVATVPRRNSDNFITNDLVNPGVEKHITMKHITRQGPVYVRSKNKLLLNDDYNIDENYFEGKCSSEHSSLKFVVDNDIKQPPSSSKMVSSCLFQSELKVCPICFKRFLASDIVCHAVACAIKFDQDLDDRILEIYDSNETLEVTFPYMVHCEKVKEVNPQENTALLLKKY